MIYLKIIEYWTSITVTWKITSFQNMYSYHFWICVLYWILILDEKLKPPHVLQVILGWERDALIWPFTRPFMAKWVCHIKIFASEPAISTVINHSMACLEATCKKNGHPKKYSRLEFLQGF